jgi:uncharacterized protein
MQSALYVGTIRHRRYFPFEHAFSYPIFMSYIDLDELPRLFKGRWFFSHHRFNLVSFLRKDFLGDARQDLKNAVLDRVQASTGERPAGPIRLLTHLRYFGLSFNPVSFYYCFEEDGQSLHSIVAEITNTPWKERFAYVLPVKTARAHGSAWHWQFDKAFHVSPFLPMQMDYSWRFQQPDEHLRVHMIVTPKPDTRTQFDSTLVLARQAWNGLNLNRSLWRFPFITLGVVWKIYWHALLIKWKRNPFYDHPESL